MKLSKLICNESHQAFGFNMKKNLSLRGGVWLERVKIFEEFVATLLSSFNKPGKIKGIEKKDDGILTSECCSHMSRTVSHIGN